LNVTTKGTFQVSQNTSLRPDDLRNPFSVIEITVLFVAVLMHMMEGSQSINL
jgi:hypothetical protein